MIKARIIRPAVLLPTLLLGAYALAGEPVLHEQHTIAVKTSGAEIFETDLTQLAVGESRTFTTDAGKTIDVIRTADGAEVYIDGELVDISSASYSGDHAVIHREVQVECISDDAGDTDCNHDIAFIGGDAGDLLDAQVIHKQYEVICDSGDDCADMVWVESDGDLDYAFETLEDPGSDGERVIVIRKHRQESVTED